MYIFEIVILYLIIFTAYLIFVQTKLSNLIIFINNNINHFSIKHQIPDWYFVFYFTKCDFSFALFLLKNKTPALFLLQKFPNYHKLRLLSNIAFFIHNCFGILAISVFFYKTVLHWLLLNTEGNWYLSHPEKAATQSPQRT